MKTLIGIVTFGCHEFTRLSLTEIFRTVKSPVDICVVVGKPDDGETVKLLDGFQRDHGSVRDEADNIGDIRMIFHNENRGFPAALNDLYDIAWGLSVLSGTSYDYLIIMGNDVVPYPGAIDALIEAAGQTEHDALCSCMFDVKALLARYPAAAKFFDGPKHAFTDFSSRPWDLHGPENIPKREIVEGNRGGLHDLSLWKRSIFGRLGYIDVNFFPAYFSDNDYWTRGILEGARFASVTESAYFHFWSRTIHQGSGGTTPRAFQLNEEFYRTKWGGPVGAEKWRQPFNGRPYELQEGLCLPTVRKIAFRAAEAEIIAYWKGKLG